VQTVIVLEELLLTINLV